MKLECHFICVVNLHTDTREIKLFVIEDIQKDIFIFLLQGTWQFLFWYTSKWLHFVRFDKLPTKALQQCKFKFLLVFEMYIN